MAINTKGLHHHHVRKRIHQKHEPYPHPIKWKRFIDHAIYVVAVVGPIMAAPQLMKIWIEKNASGVSAISWAAFMVISTFWMIYGIAHKDKPIIFISGVWIILEFFIVLGTLIHG